MFLDKSSYDIEKTCMNNKQTTKSIEKILDEIHVISKSRINKHTKKHMHILSSAAPGKEDGDFMGNTGEVGGG